MQEMGQGDSRGDGSGMQAEKAAKNPRRSSGKRGKNIG